MEIRDLESIRQAGEDAFRWDEWGVSYEGTEVMECYNCGGIDGEPQELALLEEHEIELSDCTCMDDEDDPEEPAWERKGYWWIVDC